MTKSWFNCCTLPYTGPPQWFVHQGAFDQIVTTGTSDASYVRANTPKPWRGFGSLTPANRFSQQVRMTVQFHHNGVPSVSLLHGCTLTPTILSVALFFLSRTTGYAPFAPLSDAPVDTRQPRPRWPTLPHISDNNLAMFPPM